MFEKLKSTLKIEKSGDETQDERGKKKKIENIIFLIILLIITVIIINMVWGEDNGEVKEQSDRVLAQVIEGQDNKSKQTNSYYTLQTNLEEILETIQGVGKVKVLINYAESSTTVAMYNETKTESITEEKDTEGGTRNVTSTDTQKEIAYTDENGKSSPITEKVVMPTIEGAIISAEGASNATIKANIISAAQAVTGLATHKIQVFQMQSN
jgi:stage III sporulation protein AG